jgi:hypothetical protein
MVDFQESTVFGIEVRRGVDGVTMVQWGRKNGVDYSASSMMKGRGEAMAHGGVCSREWRRRLGDQRWENGERVVALVSQEIQMNSKITAWLQGNMSQIELGHQGENRNTL